MLNRVGTDDSQALAGVMAELEVMQQHHALAMETIDQLGLQLSESYRHRLGVTTAYEMLAEAARDYLADPSGLTRPRLEFLLAKAPKQAVK